MYKQAPPPPQGGAQAGPQAGADGGAGGGNGKAQEGVIDAEYVDVEEKK